MLKKIVIGAVALSALLSSNALACACNKSANMSNMCSMKKAPYHRATLVADVVNAVSQVGLSARQTKRIADGVSEYRKTMAKISEMKIFPIDSFMDDEFNEKKFIEEMSEKSQARMAAKAALFKYVFSVLDKEQRKSFKNAYAAPLIKMMIQNY